MMIHAWEKRERLDEREYRKEKGWLVGRQRVGESVERSCPGNVNGSGESRASCLQFLPQASSLH